MYPCKPITIFEGPDCCGKTTLAEKYAQKHNATYVHFGSEPGVKTTLPRFYFEAMLLALRGHEAVVFDRSWLSEAPYAKICRNEQPRSSAVQVRMLERVAMRCGTVVVLCLPPSQVMRKNFLASSDNEYPNISQLENLRKAYISQRSFLPTIPYSYTSQTNAEIVNSIHKARYPFHNATIKSSGNFNASVAIVSSCYTRPNDNDGAYQLPGVSFDQNSVDYITATYFDAAGLSEENFFWINIDQDLRVLNAMPYLKHVIATTELASQHLDYLAINHMLIDEPKLLVAQCTKYFGGGQC